jgi:hypothetical protein
LFQRIWQFVSDESHDCVVCGTYATSYWEFYDTATGAITRRFSCAAHEQEARTD